MRPLIRNRYRVVECLGSGGTGSVYAVEDVLEDGARIALKALWPEAEEHRLVASLRSEFRVLATLRHPALCRVHDFGRLPADSPLESAPKEQRAGFFFTRDLAPGVDLGQAIEKRGRELGAVAALLAAAASALEVLHRAGMRHGDFKPKNAIVDREGRVRLIDFGLAGTEQSALCGGTLPYLAPEVLGHRLVDRRADLYALGVTLFELATGEWPSADRAGPALVAWHLRGARRSLDALRPDAPAPLVDLCARLLSPDPDSRPPSAGEAAAVLRRCAEAAGTEVCSTDAGQRELVVAPLATGYVAELERAFERRRGGRGGCALVEVVGDAGSGRSTVLTEFCWRAELRGAEVVRGRAVAGGPPLGAIGLALDQVAALTGTRLPAAVTTEETPGMRSAAIARWLGESAAKFPLVVVLDDLDFADEGSRRLTDYLAWGLPERAPVLVVASRRSDSRDGLRTAPRIDVQPLGANDIDRLIERAAGRRDRRLAARLREHTGGNLLHVVHTLTAIGARGFSPDASLGALALPPRLEGSIAAEVERAPAKERALCEVLAVLGTAAPAAMVARIVELALRAGRAGAVAGPPESAPDSEDVAAAVAGALERGFLAADVAGRVSLSRPAAVHAVYRTIAPDRRRRLHAAAAVVAGVHGARLPELLVHFTRAGDREEVARHVLPALAELQSAGDHAAALAVGTEAFALLSDAAVAPREEPLVRELCLVLGELARLAGDAVRAESFLAQIATDRPDESGASSALERARARLSLARALDDAGAFERAERLFRGAIAAGAGTEAAAAAARDLSRLLLRKGSAEEALRVVEEALAADVDDRARAHLVSARAYARGSLGIDTEAEAELARVAERAAADGDLALAATALHYGGFLAFRRGQWQLTRECYRRALDAAERIGDVVRVGTLRMNLASMDFSSGDYAASLDLYGAAVSLLVAAGARTYAVMARRNLGHLLLELGAYEQARVELGAAGRAAAEMGLIVHEIGVEGLLGIADWRAGDVAGGRRRLEVARRRFQELGDARRAAENLLDLAELELYGPAAADCDLPAAASILGEAERIPATREDTARRGRYLAMAADLAARSGDTAAARALLAELEAVVAEVRAQGGKHLEWELCRVAAIARELLGDRSEAAGHRREALSLLEAAAAALPEAYRIAFWQDPRRRLLRQGTQSGAGAAPVSTLLGGAGGHETSRLYRLLDVYRRLSTEQDLDRLLELAMDSAVELTGAERGFLLLASRGAPPLKTAVARNLSPAALESMVRVDADPESTSPDEIPYSRSIAEEVFRSGEPVVSAHAALDPRFDGARSVHALGIESVVCIPVHARGRVTGVLYLEGPGRRGLASEDLRLLMAFGDQVAVVLQNARLLADNQGRARQLADARGEIEKLLAERTELLERRTEELAVVRRDLAEVNRRFLGGRGAFGMIARSPAMERVFQVIDRVAATDLPVLVLGESGTGKELVARALHEHGARRDRPLVSLNCGALPEALLESELFGHLRGAFTGADRDRRGLFETADGGTLFLDEIGESPQRMQAALLRAVQDGIIRRVGDTRDVKVDVRVVAATNRELGELVRAGRFREDLFYRLHVVPIELPPLRDRREDVPLLCEQFLAEAAGRTGQAKKGITRRGLELLVDHAWPGNVRQLEHAITSACVMASGDILDAGDFAALLEPPPPRESRTGSTNRRDTERDRILRALEEASWNRSRAARLLGIPRRTFYRRLAEYDIQ